MGKLTPRYKKIFVNLAPGASRVWKDNDIGAQRYVYIARGILEQNPAIRFGPTGDLFTPNVGNIGLFIEWGEDFDEIEIQVPGGAAGPAIGDIVMTNCPGFNIEGV